LAPQVVDALMPKIQAELAPQVVDALMPKIQAELAPQVVDALMPKIQAEVVPAILDEIVDDPRLRNLIREQSQGLFLDAIERLRNVVARVDDKAENFGRHVFGRAPRVAAVGTGDAPPEGRRHLCRGGLSERGLSTRHQPGVVQHQSGPQFAARTATGILRQLNHIVGWPGLTGRSVRYAHLLCTCVVAGGEHCGRLSNGVADLPPQWGEVGFRGLVGTVVDPIAVPDHLGGGDAADCLQHQSEELAGSGDPSQARYVGRPLWKSLASPAVASPAVAGTAVTGVAAPGRTE
jgi:hypothetical protein